MPNYRFVLLRRLFGREIPVAETPHSLCDSSRSKVVTPDSSATHLDTNRPQPRLCWQRAARPRRTEVTCAYDADRFALIAQIVLTFAAHVGRTMRLTFRNLRVRQPEP